jgi:hypothetical protein
MKAIVLEDYESIINDYNYKKDQMIDVEELEGFNKYAIYRYYDTVDWIPKDSVRLIDKQPLKN